MRWKKASQPKNHELGDIKIIWKFLLIPRCLNHEWRWLEYAYIKCKYSRYKKYSYPGTYNIKKGWLAFKWIDSNDETLYEYLSGNDSVLWNRST